MKDRAKWHQSIVLSSCYATGIGCTLTSITCNRLALSGHKSLLQNSRRLRTTVVLFFSPSHYCQPLHFPFHCINTKRGILHFCALPARSVSFHEVLTPSLCSDIIYSCDYTVLNTQKGYFAINHEIRLFFLPSKPFETGHVESWMYTSIYYILWYITIV